MTVGSKLKSSEDVKGLEFDWLACDADRHVALFSTAGTGYVPTEFLGDTDAHDAAIESILLLPPSTAARFAPALGAGYINTWRLVAERGLFAYDCDPSGGPYRLVAAPVVPIRQDALPGAVAEVVARIALGLRFEFQPVVAEDSLRGDQGAEPGGTPSSTK